jgi:hypothetical protein
MSLIELGCACTPDCPPVGGVMGPPGPMGPIGPQGITGLDGINAFGITTSGFTMPTVGANVNVAVDDAEWATEGQVVFIGGTGGGVGYFQVAVTSTLSVMVLTNLGYPVNLAPGAPVGSGQQVSPGGLQGPQGPPWVLTSPLGINLGGTGQATQAAAFDALSPLTGPGQLIGSDGQQCISVAATNDGQVPLSDSSTPAGFTWVDSSTLHVSFNEISPLSIKGDLLVYDGTTNRRLPVGGLAGMVLTVVPSAEAGINWQPPAGFSFTRVSYARTPVVLTGIEQVVGISTPAASAPVTVVLAPITNWNNNLLCIKDESGTADRYNITVITSDGTLIQGQNQYVIDIPYGHAYFYSNGYQFYAL